MIRYVDSAGWTWEVCELEPQAAAITVATDAARFEPDVVMRTAGDVDVTPHNGMRPSLADVAVTGTQGELYFFSRVGSRKLRRYPSAWFQLARDELEELCARAEEIA